MTKKQLVKIIQEVVRREIKKEINEIFIREQKTSEPQLADVISQVSKPKEKVKYTKNKSLNDVLNETVGLSKQQNEFEEYPTLGGGTFDKSKMQELMGYGKSEEGRRETWSETIERYFNYFEEHLIEMHEYKLDPKLRTRLEAETLQGLTPQQQGIASSLRDLGISDSAIRAGIAPEGTLPGDEQRGLFFADLETAATERPLVKNPFEGTPFVSGQIGADVVNTFTRPDAKVEEIIRRGGQPILDENGFIVGAFDTNTQRVIARSGEMFNPALKPFYDKQRAAEAQERESRGENDEPMLSAEDLPPQEDAPEVVEGRNIVSSPGYQPRGPLSIAYTGLPSLAPTVLRPTYTPQTTFSPLFPLGQRRSR